MATRVVGAPATTWRRAKIQNEPIFSVKKLQNILSESNRDAGDQGNSAHEEEQKIHTHIVEEMELPEFRSDEFYGRLLKAVFQAGTQEEMLTESALETFIQKLGRLAELGKKDGKTFHSVVAEVLSHSNF